MNKILLFLFVINCAVFSSYAQTKSNTQLSIGGEFGLPVGQASDAYGVIAGVSAKLELPISVSRFSFVITSGISYLVLKYYYQGALSNGTLITPIEAGGKFYFSKMGYFEADFGVSADNYTSTGLNNSSPLGTKFTNTAFIYSPVVGLSALTNKHKATIDIGLRYESRVESSGAINDVALRVAYRFGLK
jgi:hypothetical protein